MILDCDLLTGREPATGAAVDLPTLEANMRGAGIQGGVVSSLRALTFDMESGNSGLRGEVQNRPGWFAATALDLRDPMGAELQLEAARRAGGGFVRIAAPRQGVLSHAPRIRALAKLAVDLELTLLIEGSFPDVSGAFLGIGVRAIFLDSHFYDLGEFIMIARDEPDFHVSTRLLGNPDAWELVCEHLGPRRLVFGSRPGWFEAAAVVARLESSGLDAADRALVSHENLLRLGGRE